MSTDTPTFDDFVRPLLGDRDSTPPESTPLGELAVGDFAVLAWLDDVLARYHSAVDIEADLVARWNTVSLRDVHAMLFAGTDTAGATSS